MILNMSLYSVSVKLSLLSDSGLLPDLNGDISSVGRPSQDR